MKLRHNYKNALNVILNEVKNLLYASNEICVYFDMTLRTNSVKNLIF